MKLSKQEDEATKKISKDEQCRLAYLSIAYSTNMLKNKKYVMIKPTPHIPSPDGPPSLTLTNKQTLMLVSVSELM